MSNTISKIFWLGEGETTDEYTHLFFTTKQKALDYLKKNKPSGWYGKFDENDIHEVEIDQVE